MYSGKRPGTSEVSVNVVRVVGYILKGLAVKASSGESQGGQGGRSERRLLKKYAREKREVNGWIPHLPARLWCFALMCFKQLVAILCVLHRRQARSSTNLKSNVSRCQSPGPTLERGKQASNRGWRKGTLPPGVTTRAPCQPPATPPPRKATGGDRRCPTFPIP